MGWTIVDAGVLIGFLDANDPHHTEAHVALADAEVETTGWSSRHRRLAEVLVGPSRRGRAAVGVVRDLVDRVPIDVEPLGTDIAVAAAALRVDTAPSSFPTRS